MFNLGLSMYKISAHSGFWRRVCSFFLLLLQQKISSVSS